jgi:hypothetical protein
MNGHEIAASNYVAVAVLTCIASLASFALLPAASAVIIAVAVVVEDFVALYESAVLFVNGVVVVALLGDGDDVAVSTVDIVALEVVGAAASGHSCCFSCAVLLLFLRGLFALSWTWHADK